MVQDPVWDPPPQIATADTREKQLAPQGRLPRIFGDKDAKPHPPLAGELYK